MAVTIRTITLGIGDPHPLSVEAIARAGDFLRQAQGAVEAAGYVMQTTRIATGWRQHSSTRWARVSTRSAKRRPDIWMTRSGIRVAGRSHVVRHPYDPLLPGIALHQGVDRH